MEHFADWPAGKFPGAELDCACGKRHLVGIRSIRIGSGCLRELPQLLDQLYVQLGERLAQDGGQAWLLKAAQLVRTLRGAAELNVNPGQLSGWLCAGMFSR